MNVQYLMTCIGMERYQDGCDLTGWGASYIFRQEEEHVEPRFHSGQKELIRWCY